jgi:hydrogenase nickel incorporation protein HypA/HybF
VHEASIVEGLLRLAAAHVPDPGTLRRVHVRIGALTGVSPDCMRFYFDAMTDGRAELEVVLEPLRAACSACGSHSTHGEAVWVCPACSAPALEFENGLELDLVAIEIDERC